MTKSRHIRATKVKWTPQQIDEICRRYPHERTENIARDLGLPIDRIYAKASWMGLKKTPAYLASPDACRLRRGEHVGAAFQFKKGHVPANKGVKGINYPGCQATQFKKGQLSGRARQLLKPLGAHRLSKDGILERKFTTEKRGAQRWKPVHRIVWEEAHGPIPAGHVVRFKPGMKTNILEEIKVDRLELISQADNMRRNSIHNLPSELKEVIQLNGSIRRRINCHERRKRT